jgi:hypothetical protein
VVRGYEPYEVPIACGYAFPPREVPFPVRECSDYKPKRKRNGVEIASEGVVSFPPLDNEAAGFHAVAAKWLRQGVHHQTETNIPAGAAPFTKNDAASTGDLRKQRLNY